MLGLGETPSEVLETISDLRQNKCDIITFGQYMQPSQKHYKVQKYVPPQDFLWYTKMAYCLRFKLAYGGPLVRSSYKAGEYFKQIQNA